MNAREDLLGELGRRSPALVDRVIGRLRANLDSYATVPRAALDESIREIVALVVDVIRTGDVPPFGDVEQARRTSAARSQQDVPIQDIMRAFRFTLGGIHEALVEAAQATSAPPVEMVAITNALWRFSDAYTASQVAVYRESDIDRALTQARRVQGFLQHLVEGGAPEPGLALSLGLNPAAAHYAVRARATDGLRRLLEKGGRPAVYAVLADELVGVSEDVPRVGVPAELVALGERTALSDIAASFRTAAAVLATAEALGRTGVVTVADLGWRLAAGRSPDVNRLLTARYLTPLSDQGEFGTMIVDSVRAYLRANRNIPRAARSMPVHPNTLRYRLRRFEELTGCSLDATDTIIEASFAFEVTALIGEARLS